MQRTAEKIIVGAALAAAAATLIPILKPLAAEGVQILGGLAEKARYALRIAKEEAEDIVAEAQFERMRKRLDAEIAHEV